MNLLEAIKLYCHLIQKHGNNFEARQIARCALKDNDFSEESVALIGSIVSNDGFLTDKNGCRFALTEISSS
jgi:hypothetical protein